MEEKSVKKTAKNKEGKIGDALMKVALGYQIAEVTEEYAEVNGELKLTKRKKTKKDVPPDLKAVQLLLSSAENTDFGGWTDEQLQAEKKRLLAQLQQEAAVVLDKVNTDGADKVSAAEKADGKSVAEDGAGGKSVAEKSAVKKSVAKKSVAKKSVAKKTTAKTKTKSSGKAQAKGARSVAIKKGGVKEDGAKDV